MIPVAQNQGGTPVPGDSDVTTLANAAAVSSPALPADAIDLTGASSGTYLIWLESHNSPIQVVFGADPQMRNCNANEVTLADNGPRVFVIYGALHRYMRAFSQSGDPLYYVVTDIGGGSIDVGSPWLMNGAALLQNGLHQLING